MSYRLGVDVGGTFTDLLLINEQNGTMTKAKVPSTPHDSSVGVLNGIAQICDRAGIDPKEIKEVMHGTTVATNAMLEMKGARVGLVTTKGYGQVLQIARSFVPGGLGGWVIYNKSKPLAPLSLTIEADERVDARGEVVRKLKVGALKKEMRALKKKGIEALTICLINSFENPSHEKEVGKVAREVFGRSFPISLSSEVVPEMEEYERTITTVANSYVRPKVETYISNLSRELKKQMKDVKLHVLRSDGGLASAKAAESLPVNLLMSGPAGGVSGAIWVGQQAKINNFLTFDMGGTSTDVAVVENGKAQLRRETTVGDVTVRASSVDVRTVGAGGGSIAKVPQLTGALRVGPESAGAVPGPAAYNKGGDQPAVTDANVVLGFLPSAAKLGGDMEIRYDLAEEAVKKVAKPLGLSVKEAAAGIIDIVNENMYGALRLVSVEQGKDPRDFALMGFGGAGPLHANALGKLTNAWPVVIPPGPGVLCAYGDATTAVRDEASRTFTRRFPEIKVAELVRYYKQLATKASKTLKAEGVPEKDQTTTYEADVRYHGQALRLTITFDLKDLEKKGLDVIGDQFDAQHEQLYTFALPEDKEIVNLRAVVEGEATSVKATRLPKGKAKPDAAAIVTKDHSVYVDGKDQPAIIYKREALKAGNKIAGPAIVQELDSTTVILPGHVAEVEPSGCLLINPA